jgi:hypothetical protein
VMSQSSHLPWGFIKVILWGALFVLTHFRALRSIASHFPSFLFPSIVDDTHIIGPPLIVSSTYEHFAIAILTLSSLPRQGLTKVRAKCEGQESHFMLLGVSESVREWPPIVPSELPLWELES